MTPVTVFRHVPRPITGMIGTVFNTVAPGTDLEGVLVRAT